MDMNLLYMVLGVIATIIVGYWGIKYTAKFKTKTSILYFENTCMSLFKSVVKELDELEIKYKGEIVNENLITYKGTFFNSGNVDIDSNMIHKSLDIKLPLNYEWKKVKIIDKSRDVNIEMENNPNKLAFTWDILKENEYFTFDSVIEYKPEKQEKDNSTLSSPSITRDLSRNITFEHRITNLKSIEKENIPAKPTSVFNQIFLTVYLLGFATLGLYWSAGQFIFPDYKTTYEVKIDSTRSYVTLENKGEKQIQLIDSKGDKLTIKNVSQINQDMLTGRIKTQKIDLSYWGLIGGGLLALLMLFITLKINIDHINDKRLYERIKEVAQKYDFEFRERSSTTLSLFPFE